MKSVYPLLVRNEVRGAAHHQYLDELLKQNKLKLSRSFPARVTYHDPCNLGRKSETYVPWKGEGKKVLGQFHPEEPEKVIHRAGTASMNLPATLSGACRASSCRDGEDHGVSWCCGAGSG